MEKCFKEMFFFCGTSFYGISSFSSGFLFLTDFLCLQSLSVFRDELISCCDEWWLAFHGPLFPSFNQHDNWELGQQQSIHPPPSSHTPTICPFSCPLPQRSGIPLAYLDERLYELFYPLSCCFCCSVSDCLAPGLWERSHTATEKTEKKFFCTYTILQESCKRICAYLTSPSDGEITECSAAEKSCDWRLSGLTRKGGGVTWWGAGWAQQPGQLFTVACHKHWYLSCCW